MAEVRLRFLTPLPSCAARCSQRRHRDRQPSECFARAGQSGLRDDESGVYTIVEAAGDSIGVIHQVEIGIETPETVEIFGNGIYSGMHLIVEGHYGLPDSRIHVVNKPLNPGFRRH
jgi:hypothetical protein